MSKTKLLFINTPKAVCSIHESGLMVYNCIKLSEAFSIAYMELSEQDLRVPAGYDFYLFNYHIVTTGWLDTGSIKRLPGVKGTIVLEVSPNDPFVYTSPFDFDFYCVLDPSLTLKHKKVFAFPRPLENYSGELPKPDSPIPVIGSFGFATKGKGFEHVIEAVNKEFEQAIVRINIPHGSYTDPSHAYAQQLADTCKKLAKPGIEVRVTHDFMEKSELIKWCSQNTLNCFLYDRNMPGLAATTDQAIISEQPLAISNNNTFRHILSSIRPYPEVTLKEAILTTAPLVKQLKIDWSPANFVRLFEEMIRQLAGGNAKVDESQRMIQLQRLNRKSPVYKLKKQVNRLARLYYKSPLYAIFH